LSRTFGDLSPRTQGLVFVLLTLLVPAVVWRTWLGPERLALESRRARLAAALAEIVRLRTSVSALSSAQRELRGLEARFTAPVEQGPASSRHLLAALHDAAMQSGIALSSFSAASPSAVAPSQAPRATVEARRVQFELEGGFPEFVVFLSRLVRLPQVASVPDIAIRALTRQLEHRTITATVVATTTDQNTFVIGDLPVTYDSAGKRDPFQDPLAMTTVAGEPPGGIDRPARAGLASVPVGEVAVKGIARWGGTITAILEGPDRRTFVARPKDRLLDAVIVRMDERGVVFTTAVTGDPSAASAEIRKNLASNSGVRR
jgi:Tfp pilus assembly protein PilO